MSEIKGAVATKGIMKGALQGLYGKDGLSAYEVAVENGFEGSETEWLTSLKGEQGEKGDKGDTGIGVSGVYVGSGDMPDGYNVQIDPNGDALALDNYYTKYEVDTIVGDIETLLGGI